MTKIIILAIGKIKEPHYRSAVEEYLKRLRPYLKVEMAELRPEPFNAANHLRAKAKEAERLTEFLGKYQKNQIYLLDERGAEMTSEKLARFLDQQCETLVLVIGGALGFSDEIKKAYSHKIALSQLTLPHELARVVLAEQLYRAVAIVKGKEYHY
ncbi:MAG: 23S rRNA (pseudouridine(1915)-N(3))-methyltransferase RlmH [Patescibacteria group bacterium]|jgi:23S rRNA (pseudouridine1915-N3)-methyltransferase